MQETTIIEDLELITETAKAYLFEKDGEEIWIPKSQVFNMKKGEYNPGTDTTEIHEIEIPEWLAEQEGLA